MQVKIFQVKNYYTDHYYFDIGGKPGRKGDQKDRVLNDNCVKKNCVKMVLEINIITFRAEKATGEKNQHMGSYL